MNKTMHNMIAERDNLMEGIYDYKPTANVGTDPMESAARVDEGSQYRREDFLKTMRDSYEAGEPVAWPVKGLWAKIQGVEAACQTKSTGDQTRYAVPTK